MKRLLAFFVVLSVTAPAVRGQDAAARASLERWIDRIRESHDIDAISVAVVKGDAVVWSGGFGREDAAAGIPASPSSIYRVGSISKLYTDIALMQLVEEGKVDLDAPLEKALPDFHAKSGWEKKVTLRQIMAHRAGIVREPPVGHYFDPERPSVAATVASLAETELIHEPGSKFKYSNAGITIVGRVVEVLRGKPFEEAIAESLLIPLGTPKATFARSPDRLPGQVVAKMWTLDGRDFPAPTFSMGIGPAGDLRASAVDLARFAICLMNGGATESGRILPKSRIEEMWTPKFDKNGARVDVGIGFFVSKLDGRRRVGHGGAVYGCATELMILPDDRLAVAVATSKDCANGVATRIAETILRTELAHRAGEPVPELSVSQPVGAALARSVAGSFGGETGVELVASGSRLFVFPRAGGARSELRRDGNGASFVVDDEQAFGARYRIEGDRLLIGDRPPLVRSVDPPPPSLPEAWRPLLGEYGWDHNVLNILEKDGKLQALIEWFFLYPLTDAGNGRFRFPTFGLYSDEDVTFERNDAGKVTAVIAAGVRFPRRPIDGEDGRTFRITPLRPIEELRGEAAKAKPPEERGEFLASDLVDLTTLDSTIHLDIRYATDNNFLGVPVYSSARAFLQRPAAEALLRAHWSLARQGYGLLIHDGYRPWSVTKIFYDATPQASRGFVADPSTGSRHNRGCAVDLSLYDMKTGRPVEMVGGYDEFSPRAYPDYLGGTTAQRRLRSLLRTAMEAEGFVVIPNEWWHFDYRDWRRYRIGNEPFESIKGKAGAQP